MHLVDRFIENVRKENLFERTDLLVLAVSGGVDSVALCEICRSAGFNFVIAHCNFQLRAAESDRDEEFVSRLAEKYNTKILVKRFDTEAYAQQHAVSIQEAARDLRYHWFFEICRDAGKYFPGYHDVNTAQKQKTFLVTAHHADDNAETVLMNFCRGTGLRGLTGIPSKGSGKIHQSVRRPLLPFTKQELLAFAQERNLEYVEDSSNRASKYTRNLFRNEIMPRIETVYPALNKNLRENITRFKEIESLYSLAVGRIIAKLSKHVGDEVHIPVKQLISYGNRSLIYELISPYGFSEKQVDEVIKLSDSESGRYIESPGGGFRLIRHRHWFIITPTAPAQSLNIVIDETSDLVQFGDEPGSRRQLRISRENGSMENIETDPNTACLDLSQVQFPLLLRKWKQGDYFYPLGMKKKKKLARFFIDNKLSLAEKEKVWVLEMNRKILWVVGYRIDDRFKMTASSAQSLKIVTAPCSGDKV